ncbi:hypothetical protein M9Y10_038056 [Tritrichomonas musculus]|uniref:RBR-type E3 ubiquitin transferase n=1 Tax=Tritrichomonas musculus TaxID=1915356 RepID=A0ABR2K7D1_9EUKA
MSQKVIDTNFIQDVAISVISLIPPDENRCFYDSVMQYDYDEGSFPPDIDKQIFEKLSHLTNKNIQASKTISDYQLIIKENDFNKIYHLHQLIFYPQSEGCSVDIGGDDEDNYFGDDDDDNDNNFENVDIESPKVIKKQPVITLEELGRIQEDVIAQISEVFSLNIEIAELLLKVFDFKKDDLFDSYATDPESNLAKIGLTSKQTQEPVHFRKRKCKEQPNTNESCGICFDDEENGLVLYSLPCGHLFCKDCISDHLKSEISKGKFEILCPMHDCKCHAVISDVIKFCGKQIATNYYNFILEREIVSEGDYVHCLSPGCPNILTKDSVGLCDVATCTCGCRMCWKCKQPAHAPLDCNMIEKWQKIAKEENAELNWIKKNTKQCPKCHERIEKNGGCNHMTCYNCHYEFCWICGHEWNSHEGDGYNCNKYTDFDNIKLKDEPNIDLDRLAFYLTRFFSHKVSQTNEQKEKENKQIRLITHFEDYSVPSERLNIEDALELTNEIFLAIDVARSVLIWSYPHAFFMKPGSKRLALFEFVQKEVERVLELVTDMVENKPDESPSKFRKMMNLLKFNTDSLNKHVDSSTRQIKGLFE